MRDRVLFLLVVAVLIASWAGACRAQVYRECRATGRSLRYCSILAWG